MKRTFFGDDGVVANAKSAKGSGGDSAKRETLSELPEQVAAEVRLLRDQIQHHDVLYHSKGQPEVSDEHYDALKARLRQLEGGRPGQAKATVGAPVTSSLPKVQHLLRMLSLNSVNSRESVRSWNQKVLRKLPPAAAEAAGPEGKGLDWVIEPKVDGLAVSLIYEDGSLWRAATRGDGIFGEDVTHNAAVIQGLPVKIPSTGSNGSSALPDRFEVRGEVYMTHADLALVNQQQAASGSRATPLANARNAAAGSLRLLDPQQCAARRLSFLAYQLLPLGSDTVKSANGAAAALPKTQWESLQWLASHGFAVSPDNKKVTGGMEEAIKAAEQWMARRDQLGYEADGVVFKIDDLQLQQELGYSGSDPRWALALKFPSQQAVTRLRSLQLSVGRTGQVIPVAELEPVALNGVSIGYASLHNLGQVEAMDLMVGDMVIVRRAGDVIPQIVRPLKELRTGKEVKWTAPNSCPCCGSALETQAVLKGDGSTLWCRNPECDAQTARQVLHFATTCLEGTNMGPSVVDQLQEAHLVMDVAGFFHLKEVQLLQLPRFGLKRTATILEGIEAAKSMPLGTLLAGLNIRHVGAKTAKDLGEAFGSAEELKDATLEQIKAVPGIGDKTAEGIVAWMAKPANQALLTRLKEAGVLCISAQPPSKAPPSKPGKASTGKTGGQGAPLKGVQGMSIVVTGSLGSKGLTREQFHAILEECGAKLSESVSKSTSLVVTGTKPGASKLDKASRLGVEVLTEEEFWKKYGAK